LGIVGQPTHLLIPVIRQHELLSELVRVWDRGPQVDLGFDNIQMAAVQTLIWKGSRFKEEERVQ
jgi:hypothetical protein